MPDLLIKLEIGDNGHEEPRAVARRLEYMIRHLKGVYDYQFIKLWDAGIDVTVTESPDRTMNDQIWVTLR